MEKWLSGWMRGWEGRGWVNDFLSLNVQNRCAPDVARMSVCVCVCVCVSVCL